MTWTEAVPPQSAPAPLAALYQRIRAESPAGAVSNLWQAMGADPRGLAATYELFRALMVEPAALSSAQAEAVALVVSATNGCAYCVAHHGRRYAAACGDEALARAVALDYREANLTARDRVLLDYAVALTCEPSERTRADVERVREYGFSDAAILAATEITGLLAHVTRIANGLGVPLEPGVEPWEYGAQR